MDYSISVTGTVQVAIHTNIMNWPDYRKYSDTLLEPPLLAVHIVHTEITGITPVHLAIYFIVLIIPGISSHFGITFHLSEFRQGIYEHLKRATKLPKACAPCDWLKLFWPAARYDLSVLLAQTSQIYCDCEEHRPIYHKVVFENITKVVSFMNVYHNCRFWVMQHLFQGLGSNVMDWPIYGFITQYIGGCKYWTVYGFCDPYKVLIRLYQNLGDSLMIGHHI